VFGVWEVGHCNWVPLYCEIGRGHPMENFLNVDIFTSDYNSGCPWVASDNAPLVGISSWQYYSPGKIYQKMPREWFWSCASLGHAESPTYVFLALPQATLQSVIIPPLGRIFILCSCTSFDRTESPTCVCRPCYKAQQFLLWKGARLLYPSQRSGVTRSTVSLKVLTGLRASNRPTRVYCIS
jgi:hypothetical protein